MDMPPPPPMMGLNSTSRHSAKHARVLPPVPREPPLPAAAPAAPSADTTPAATVGTQAEGHAQAPAVGALASTSSSSSSSSASPGDVRNRSAPLPGAPLPSGSFYTVPLWSSAPLHPYSLSVVKDGREVAEIPLCQRSHFLVGRAADLVDIPLDHASISRRHAVLQFHESGTLHLYDLAAAHGTFVNRTRVQPHTYIQLNVGDQLKFGASTRIYIVDGPEEARPKEVDREALAQQQAKLQLQAREAHRQAALEEKRRSKSANADDEETGASWGMGEDAVNSDDEDRGVILNGDDNGSSRSVALPKQLTQQQQRMSDTLTKKREKMHNLGTEVETLRGKDIRQGGLTEGQEKQIAKNEERMQALMQEIEDLEQQLQESIERVAGDREKSKEAAAGAAGKKRRRAGSDDEDAGSEDDDFYDRTRLPKAVSSAPSATAASLVTSTSSFLSTLTPMSSLQTPDSISAELKRLELKRDQMRHTLGEVAVQEQKEKRAAAAAASSAGVSVDSLESFMSSITHTQLTARRATLKSNLAELQTHYIKLQRTLEQKKGEILAKQYLEGDKDAFSKAKTVEAEVGAAVVAPKPTQTAVTAPTAGPTQPPDLTEPTTITAASTAPAPLPTLPTSAVPSTAEMLARLKRKQEAAARKAREASAAEDRAEEEKQRADAQKPVSLLTRADVAAMAKAAAAPAATSEDRYAQLAAQLEAARGAAHRNYSTLPEDDVARRLRENAARSAQSMSRGLTGDEHRGGLHVRDRGSKADSMSAPPRTTLGTLRIAGPAAPAAESAAMQDVHESESVEWTPPVVTSAVGQDKLRAKFAGRY